MSQQDLATRHVHSQHSGNFRPEIRQFSTRNPVETSRSELLTRGLAVAGGERAGVRGTNLQAVRLRIRVPAANSRRAPQVLSPSLFDRVTDQKWGSEAYGIA